MWWKQNGFVEIFIWLLFWFGDGLHRLVFLYIKDVSTSSSSAGKAAQFGPIVVFIKIHAFKLQFKSNAFPNGINFDGELFNRYIELWIKF